MRIFSIGAALGATSSLQALVAADEQVAATSTETNWEPSVLDIKSFNELVVDMT